jgi:hypothetical protein
MASPNGRAQTRSDDTPIEDRNRETGTVLRVRYKGKERRCGVVHTADGLRYRLDDGTEHKSPSSAGKAAMAGGACNGWRFWSVAGTGAATSERAKKAPAAKKPAKAKAAAKKSAKVKGAKPKKSKAVRAAASDRRVAAETASYGCGVCGETFPTMKVASQHATEAHLS